MINGHKLKGLIGEREQRNMQGGRRRNTKWPRCASCCVMTELLFERSGERDRALCQIGELKLFHTKVTKGA